MRPTEIIKLMPTQYRQTTENPLVAGHHIPMLGYWTKSEGYVKTQSLSYKGESLACPIIAVVTSKMGGEDVDLTITTKISEYSSTQSKTQGNYTIKRKTYIPTSTTKQTTLKIPRHTRQYATFLLSGLGKLNYEITSITDNCTYDVGKVEFYALASSGSRIIYWLGIHKVAEELKEILRGIWLAPTKCIRCEGTGIEPNTISTNCKQCSGYGYSGYNASKYIQRMKSMDVGLVREILDWDNLTESDHDIIVKFINKCWTQKWWCTPTVTEIKRLFAHFYNTPRLQKVIIYQHFDYHEPVWNILLPFRTYTGSPFGTLTLSDQELLRYIAESVTPAGVNVFVGFYQDFEEVIFIGNIDDFEISKFHYLSQHSVAFGQKYGVWGDGIQRWDFYNGWTLAVDDFETLDSTPNWRINGSVDILNVNDQNRHMVRLQNFAYMETGAGIPTGCFEFWVHPQNAIMRIGLHECSGCGSDQWGGYVEFNEDIISDNNGSILRKASKDSDYHLRMYYDLENNLISEVDINLIPHGTGFEFVNIIGTGCTCVRVQTYGTGYGYIDAYGNNWNDPTYDIGDNWQRLHPIGFDLDNKDYATGAGGVVKTIELHDKYIRMDKFWNVK